MKILHNITNAIYHLLRLLNFVFLFASVLFLFTFCYIYVAKVLKAEVPRLGPVTFHSVDSGGMAPQIRQDDVSVSLTAKPESIKAGDIIIFTAENRAEPRKIVEIEKNKRTEVYIYETRDNEKRDSFTLNAEETAGRFMFRLPGWGGYLGRTLDKPVLLLVPVLIFAVIEVLIYLLLRFLKKSSRPWLQTNI